MKHPLWILNISLLALLIVALGFILLSRPRVPSIADITPEITTKPLGAETISVNITKIYEDDLFGTYRKEMPAYQPGALPPLPEPPIAKPVSVPPVPTPQFLEPLNITLRGIIIVLSDENDNRAIIADNKTNKEATYHVGQKFEDAQLIRILNNKIIFLRSNGQQEVLYLREKDAKLDPAYAFNNHFDDVVQKITESQFNVSPREFINRIKNLAQLIDLLDLTTVYKDGKNYGTRVGQAGSNSIGSALGLLHGDIVMQVNGIPATNTSNRFAIYKQIENLKENDTITVKIQRGGTAVTLRYTLKEFRPSTVSKSERVPSTTTVTREETTSVDWLKEEQLKSLESRRKLAPTVNEIHEQEKKALLQKSKSTARTSTNKNTE